MSEYWVSKNKYYCKYCETYIADDAPSRNQHETGLRHKGNKERFVRNLYKTSEKRKQDLEEEKREMARVEKAAQAAFARDVGAGLAKGSEGPTPRASTSAAASQKPPPKPSNAYANYSTAESLGYTDPDAERAQAEAEVRRTQGVAGEWEVVERSIPAVAPEAEPESEAGPSEPVVGSKRVAEALDEEDDVREFKLKKKTVGAGLGQLYDPGVIPIKLKTKEHQAETSNDAISSKTEPSDGPKWSSRGWKRPGEADEIAQAVKHEDSNGADDGIKREDVLPKVEDSASEIKQEDVLLKVEESETKPILPSADTSEAPVMFRKRKIPAGGAGSRGRRT